MSSGKLCVLVSIGRAGSPGKYQTSRAVLVSAYTCVHPRIPPQKASNPTKHSEKALQDQTKSSYLATNRLSQWKKTQQCIHLNWSYRNSLNIIGNARRRSIKYVDNYHVYQQLQNIKFRSNVDIWKSFSSFVCWWSDDESTSFKPFLFYFCIEVTT